MYQVFRRRRRGSDASPAQTTEPSDVDDSPTDDTDDTDTDGADTDVEPAGAEPDLAESPKSERPDGPFDASEVDLDEARTGRVDLGGMLIKGAEGMQLQLQVDQRTGNATSVLLGIGDAAVQLVAVAAPRSSGLWGQTRLQIAADARRRGGTAEDATGPFGPEVRVVVPVTTPEGKQGVQPSRVSGIDGPRWLLRVTFLGKATTDAATLQRLVHIVRSVVVIRGDAPMAPGDVITLQPPPGATVQGQQTPPPAS
ncbi:MAG TPA: DUF3710 domain-containing protein [Jiangellaceae bacterium]|nr:DUF3710 domain-containing protein [Jiangellaceae bacterium]